MIYADEVSMMRYSFGDDWPRELTHIHEIAEQVYANLSGLIKAAGK